MTFRAFGQTLSSLTYVSTYEVVREVTSHPFIAGFAASCTASCINCPFDVVNQYVILLSKQATSQHEVQILKSLQPLRFPKEVRHGGRWILEASVIKDVGNRHGFKGFWRALPLLMINNGLHSALWWSSFEFVSGILHYVYYIQFSHFPSLLMYRNITRALVQNGMKTPCFLAYWLNHYCTMIMY